ncbi:3'-5' exonuclease [Aureimonas leprariae]|uniref:3'-5' exonuclease n=1 Tax=Plantimonas leprariae TaxID=2615207 RepID=A0A7V7TY04_9HYPH|nr:3'-5' exonuclease [Aureimonas leprariae]KAB0676439.1 3'-5' exonuclease [Aureimonas leprariae]
MQMDFLTDLDEGDDGGDGDGDRSVADARCDETDARRLERTGRYRVLRRLEHRPVRHDAPRSDGHDLKLGVVVDTETTGLDPRRCEVIEIAAVAFTYDDTRIRDVVGVFEALEQPRCSLSPPIVRLTGLTDADVKGRAIDRAALTAFVAPADLVIAHNAGFDRPFCETLAPVFAAKRWACSATDVGWKDLGADGAKLTHLLAEVGLFHSAHRALTDCFALLEVLAAPKWGGRNGAFARLVAAANLETYEIRAERTPYDMRSVLKERGYRWSPGADGKPKCWMRTVGETALGAEMHWLRYEIYRDEDMPVVRKLGAADRFRKDRASSRP